MENAPMMTRDNRTLYRNNLKSVEYIENREPYTLETTDQKNTYIPRDKIKIEVAHGEFEDGCMSALNFTLNVLDQKDGSAISDGSFNINSVLDLVERFSVYRGSNRLEYYDNAALWANLRLVAKANDSFVDNEGGILLGYNSQMTTANASDVGADTSGRTFQLPIGLFSGFFRSDRFLPVLDEPIRVEMELAPAEKVFSYIASGVPSTVTYSLSNVQYTGNAVVTSPLHKEMFLNLVKSPQAPGIYMPFTAIQSQDFDGTGGNTQNKQINYNNSNALSLFIIRQGPNSPAVNNVGDYVNPNLSAPIQDVEFKRLIVRSGLNYYTPKEGLESLTELYTSTKSTLADYCDLNGHGLYDWKTWSGSNRVSSNAKSIGYTPMGINFSKIIGAFDDAVVDDGISSKRAGASNMINFVLETENPIAQSDKLHTAIFSQRYLLLKNNGSMLIE